MSEITRIAIDTSKSVFTLHAVDASDRPVLRRNLRRKDMVPFFSGLPPVEVVMEACGGSHYWGRTMSALGHRVRLIPAQYVKPFVKRAKNDRNDAEAINEAAARPGMREVAVKSAAAQARAMLLSVRELLVRQRTQLINALRGHAAEMGLVAPIGDKGLATLRTDIASDKALPALASKALQLLGGEIDRLTTRLAVIDKQLMAQHRSNPESRRLSAIPGVGPMSALSFALKVDPSQFKSGRHFAAWLGLVPREASTEGKQRLGGISRAGNERLRQLLVLGATAVIRFAKPGRPSVSALANRLAGAQAAQARGRLSGQQDGPDHLGHADERGRLPTGNTGRRLARFVVPQVQGQPEEMSIVRTDDPQNPRRVAAFKVSLPFGRGSRNPSGPAASTPRPTGRTHDRFHTGSNLFKKLLHPKGRPHTPYVFWTNLNAIGWAPCHRVSRPSSGSCSRPSTMVRKWLPASCPTLLAKRTAP
jgi:transposase